MLLAGSGRGCKWLRCSDLVVAEVASIELSSSSVVTRIESRRLMRNSQMKIGLTSDLSTVGYVASVTPEACEVTFSRNRLLTDLARLGSLNNRGF